MESSTLEEKIFLLNNQLLGKEKISQALFLILQEKYRGKYNRKYGFILDMDSNITIVGNRIASDSSGVIFDVQYKAETFNPEIGKTYEGRVTNVFADVFFAVINDVLKVMVPSANMPNYRYSKSGMCFKKKGVQIRQDDNVSILLTDLNLSNGEYCAVGRCD